VYGVFFRLTSASFSKKQCALSDQQANRLLVALLTQLRRLGQQQPQVDPKPAQGWTSVDGLRALSYLLFENSDKVADQWSALKGLLLPLVKSPPGGPVTRNAGLSPGPGDEIQRMAINCVGNMCLKGRTQPQDDLVAMLEVGLTPRHL
jgi:hypothetical protein